MTATIKLMVTSGSGVLAAVASQLQAAGIRVKSHNVEAADDGGSMLTVSGDVTGGFDEADLRGRLSGVEVVRRIEEISSAADQVAGPAPAAKIPDALVDRIVAAYPKIMPHIQNYEEQLTKDPDKADKLRQLGVEAGLKLGAQRQSGASGSLSELIDEVLVPVVGSIAEASRDGDTVVVPVSLFTRRVVTSMDLFSGENENCDFLCGLIEGMAASVPGYESISVTETRCRANGDPVCVFSCS